MKKILKTLELTENEILVYEALARLRGASFAGPIIKDTDMHRNMVYDSLSHLVRRGLVSQAQRDKKKYFTLRPPDKVQQTYRQQLADAEKLASIVERIPLLSGHTVDVFEGTQAWQEAWRGAMESLEPRAIFYTLGMAGDAWVELMGETFVAYESWALENRIIDRIVSQKHLQGEILAHQDEAFREIRYLDIDLPAHTSIEIFPDRIFFEIYDAPETLIQIKSESLVKTFKAYFDLLWSTGERIKKVQKKA